MSDLIIINGEDDFLKERAAMDEASMSLSGSVVQMWLPEDHDQYLERLEFRPLRPGEESVILWNAKEVPEYLLDDIVIVVASGKKTLSDARAKRVLNFSKLKTRNGGEEVIRWALKEGDALNIDLSHVASGLFVNCGNDLRKISSEIKKLAAITPRGQAVDPAVARKIVCFSASVTPGSLVDAVRNGNAVQALAFFDKLQEKGDETGWIIAYMQRLVLQSAHAQVLSILGISNDQAAEVLGIPPWTYRNVSMCFNSWSLRFLVSSAERLRELDVMHKGGKDYARFGLELEIIRLSEEAKGS